LGWTNECPATDEQITGEVPPIVALVVRERIGSKGIELDSACSPQERLQVGSPELDVADEGVVRLGVVAVNATSGRDDVTPELGWCVVQHENCLWGRRGLVSDNGLFYLSG